MKMCIRKIMNKIMIRRKYYLNSDSQNCIKQFLFGLHWPGKNPRYNKSYGP